MTQLDITIEALNGELINAYAQSDMDRGQSGPQAISWTFNDNPKPFAVARSNGEVIGISGYIRRRAQFSGFGGVALQAVDSFVAERARGQGVFSRLARAYHAYAASVGCDLIWGFPNDNAAPAWFGKLGWTRHGQTPFMFKPLRSGYFTRKVGLSTNVRLTLARGDRGISPIDSVGEWGDVLWDVAAPQIGVGIIRDREFLQHRLFDCPSVRYRVVADADAANPAIVVTREAEKHGGRIAYLMEALGGPSLRSLLMSELGYLAERDVEIVLAWSYPWSPNYRELRRAGFIPLPERLRPINIWFGGTALSPRAQRALQDGQWYLSYLDSDTA